MTQWEYKLESMSRKFGTEDAIAEFLTELGKQGWELCSIDYGCFILKRPILKAI